MGLKNFIRKRIAKFLGIYPLQMDLREIIRELKILKATNTANNIIKSNVPQAIKNDFYLQSYTTPGGGIRFCNASDNIKAYLNLVRFITSDSIKLKRFGGGYDGGYVMMVPPGLESKVSYMTLNTNNKGEIISIDSKNNQCLPPPRM